MKTKFCKGCTTVKNTTEFSPNGKTKFYYLCKPCMAKKNKAKYHENKVPWKESTKRYYNKNKEVIKANSKYHYYAIKNSTEYKIKKKAYDKQYVAKNRAELTAKEARRRSQKLKATPPWLTDTHIMEIKSIYLKAKELEKIDGIKRHVDHIYPLRGHNLCGLHVPWNLQILTQSENCKKSNKIVELLK
jgi:hypothetical protein